jgi:hypothetical protein
VTLCFVCVRTCGGRGAVRRSIVTTNYEELVGRSDGGNRMTRTRNMRTHSGKSSTDVYRF